LPRQTSYAHQLWGKPLTFDFSSLLFSAALPGSAQAINAIYSQAVAYATCRQSPRDVI
jgi:hypothetical protein